MGAHCATDRVGLDEIFSASLPPLERLHRWFRAVEDTQQRLRAAHGRTLGCPLGTIGAECATQEPELAAFVGEQMARNARYVETAIRDAQAEGTVRADVGARELAAGLVTYLEGILVQARIRDDPDVAARLEVGLRLLAGPPSKPELRRRRAAAKRRRG